jgi:hypothetical protein
MKNIDKIVFGDNQFFGINHMSQEKAQQLAEMFYNIDNIIRIYDMVYASGVRGIMLNSNDRALEITDYFKKNSSKYPDLSWYPSIPYPHKYANLISEKGIIPTINDVLFKDNSALGILGMMAKGGAAIINKDVVRLMQMLIDIEMRMFKGLNVKVIFLQNIITDLILGFDLKEIFFEYCEYIKKKYDVLPGLITQNLPVLKSKLEEWKIEEVVICSSVNKIGYLMSPSIDDYISTINNNDINKYQIMAMSSLASGAISPNEAYEFINKLNIQSVVFGASSKQHIKQTVDLINLK